MGGDLADAACASIIGHPEGRWEDYVENPAAVLVQYSDGFRATILWVDGEQKRPMPDIVCMRA